MWGKANRPASGSGDNRKMQENSMGDKIRYQEPHIKTYPRLLTKKIYIKYRIDKILASNNVIYGIDCISKWFQNCLSTIAY